MHNNTVYFNVYNVALYTCCYLLPLTRSTVRRGPPQSPSVQQQSSPPQNNHHHHHHHHRRYSRELSASKSHERGRSGMPSPPPMAAMSNVAHYSRGWLPPNTASPQQAAYHDNERQKRSNDLTGANRSMDVSAEQFKYNEKLMISQSGDKSQSQEKSSVEMKLSRDLSMEKSEKRVSRSKKKSKGEVLFFYY